MMMAINPSAGWAELHRPQQSSGSEGALRRRLKNGHSLRRTFDDDPFTSWAADVDRERKVRCNSSADGLHKGGGIHHRHQHATT